MRASWLFIASGVLIAGSSLAAPQWRALPAAPVAIRIDDIHFLDEDHGWACAGDGTIWRTTNGGTSWSRLLNRPDVYFRCIRFLADGMHGWTGGLYTDTLMWATTNGGATWSTVTNIPEPK